MQGHVGSIIKRLFQLNTVTVQLNTVTVQLNNLLLFPLNCHAFNSDL